MKEFEFPGVKHRNGVDVQRFKLVQYLFPFFIVNIGIGFPYFLSGGVKSCTVARLSQQDSMPDCEVVLIRSEFGLFAGPEIQLDHRQVCWHTIW